MGEKKRNDTRADVTIVCCYNDEKQYERLQASLAKQNIEYDIIGIDNRGQRFPSCSSALNSAMDGIRTEYVIYSHQDIELPEPDMLEHFLAYLKQIGEADILGVAGAVDAARLVDAGARMKKEPEKADARAGMKREPEKVDAGEHVPGDGTCVASYVRHGASLTCAGEVEFSGMMACDTVDECFFGGRTETFRREPFDEKLCDNWHLYAVERCLRARVQESRVWVCDLPLLHHSSGTINHAYNENFRRIAAHYAKRSAEESGQNAGEKGQNAKTRVTYIRTVCGSTGTGWLHRNLFYWKRELLFRLHRL